MSIIRHPRIPNSSEIWAQNPCVGQKIILESVLLKYYKIVETMTRWLRAFAQVCIYIVILSKVECEAMIVI